MEEIAPIPAIKDESVNDRGQRKQVQKLVCPQLFKRIHSLLADINQSWRLTHVCDHPLRIMCLFYIMEEFCSPLHSRTYKVKLICFIFIYWLCYIDSANANPEYRYSCWKQSADKTWCLPKRVVLQSQRTGRPPSWVFPEPLPRAEIPFLQTACLFSMNKL